VDRTTIPTLSCDDLIALVEAQAKQMAALTTGIVAWAARRHEIGERMAPG
jgi:hypothetical protein